ncbi:family 16 glycoside hydrolase [Flindersiella endophytica]
MAEEQPRITRKGFLRAAGLTGGLALSGGAGVLGAVTGARTAAAGAAIVPAGGPGASVAVPGGPILAGDRFPIGLFWPPPPFQTTLRRYEEIAEAGFTFSHSNNYLWGDSHIQRYVLSIADQVGLQVLVDDPTIRWLVHDFDVRDDGGEFTVTTAEARKAVQRALNTYRPPGYWSISDGRLFQNGGTGEGSVGLSRPGADWTDYTFAVDVTPKQTGGGGTYAQAGLAFRAQDSRNAYVWLLSNSGYTTPKAPGYLAKALFVDGAPVWVRPVPLDLAVTDGTSYHVEIAVSGNTIRTSINGTVVDTTTDSTHPKGKVGFREAGPESAYFDNVTVTSPAGDVLFSDDFSGGLGQWSPAGADGYASFAGFDIYDEPQSGKFATLAAAVGIVKELAPDVLPYVNLLPNFEGGAGYARAAQAIRPLQLSYDRYPILSSGEDTGYFKNWADVRAAALGAGIPSWMFIQSVGYNGHATPTSADLLWQINISLAYGCKAIQYFTYWTPDPARGEGFTDALLTRNGKRTALYDAAKDINNGYLSRIGMELLPLVSESVSVAGLASPPSGLTVFTPDAYVADVSGGPCVLGRFTGDASDPTRWLLLSNYARRASASVAVTVGSIVRTVEAYDPASRSWKPVSRDDVRFTVPPGAARLLRLRS